MRLHVVLITMLLVLCMFYECLNIQCQSNATTNQARLLRIAVLDTSASMDGERLSLAKKELIVIADQLKPSVEYPFMVIPFNGDVREDLVGIFTNQQSLKEHINKIDSNGSTSIASGLARAIDELKNYSNVHHAMVLLYTDGEDNDTQAIIAQETTLDNIFSIRKKNGLQNTVVFCKRWEASLAGLVTRIEKRGNAKVLDAGEARIIPITFVPNLKFMNASWDSAKPGLLKITARAMIEVRGIPPEKMSNLKIRCLSKMCQGFSDAEIQAGKEGVRLFYSKLLFSPNKIPQNSSIGVPFEILLPDKLEIKTGVILPTIAPKIVILNVQVPPYPIQCSFAAKLSASGPSEWVDPLALDAVFPAKIEISTLSSQPNIWSGKVNFTIETKAPWSIEGPAKTIEVNGPKLSFLKLRLRLSLSQKTRANAKGIVNAKLKIRLNKNSPSLVFTKKDCTVECNFKIPNPIVRNIKGNIVSSTIPRWIDPLSGEATFNVVAEFNVDGPLKRESTLVLIGPPMITRMEIEPNHLVTGIQLVKIGITARIHPAPKQTNIELNVVPKKNQGAIEIRTGQPLSVDVLGPKPLQLVATKEGIVPAAFDVKLTNENEAACLTVIPTLIGWDCGNPIPGVNSILSCVGGLELRESIVASINVATSIYIKTRSGTASSEFWRDKYIEGSLLIKPATPTQAILGSRQIVIVRIEAKFKRILVYISIGIFILVAGFILINLISKIINS